MQVSILSKKGFYHLALNFSYKRCRFETFSGALFSMDTWIIASEHVKANPWRTQSATHCGNISRLSFQTQTFATTLRSHTSLIMFCNSHSCCIIIWNLGYSAWPPDLESHSFDIWASIIRCEDLQRIWYYFHEHKRWPVNAVAFTHYNPLRFTMKTPISNVLLCVTLSSK